MTASPETLRRLHKLVARELIRKFEGGEWTAQDVAAAIRYLKNNGIVASRDIASIQEALASIPEMPPLSKET